MIIMSLPLIAAKHIYSLVEADASLQTKHNHSAFFYFGTLRATGKKTPTTSYYFFWNTCWGGKKGLEVKISKKAMLGVVSYENFPTFSL
jgi:hypothetical protein